MVILMSLFTAAVRTYLPGMAILLGGLVIQSAVYASDNNAVLPDTIAQRVMACATCHGKDGRASNDGFYPRIAGKPAHYLYNQLVNFRDGRRQYPSMTYLLDYLSDDYLMQMAEFYASQNPPYPSPQPVTAEPAAMARGKQLVYEGDKAKNIPACVTCHGQKLTGIAPSIPGLVGLPRDYLNAQFGAWKSGSRKAHAPDCMADITANMSIEDINAASSWLAAQPVPANAKPEPALLTKLPMSCGGIKQ